MASPRSRQAGQSLVELLIAVFILGLMATVVVLLSVVTSQTLFRSSRHVAAQALLNEHLEYLRSLPYDDIGFTSGAPFPGMVEPEEVRQIGGTDYRRRTTLACEGGAVSEGCLKRLEVFVHWEDPGAGQRSVRAVTLAAPRLKLFNCHACPGGTSCKAGLGMCLPGTAAATGPRTCAPGLLCPADGSLCPADGICRGGEAVYYQPPADPAGGSEGCVPGQLCSTGALCPYSGVCPTQVCPTGSCPGDQTCFNSFCYDAGWFYDRGLSVSEAGKFQCQTSRCDTSLDCPQPCAVAGGDLTLVYRCEPGWVPACRAGSGGGAVRATAGGGERCRPEACPASGQCANGQRCAETSSNQECRSDADCESGEMCDGRRLPGPLGECRTVCATEAECTVYWGGAAKGCRPYAVSGVDSAAVESCPATVVPAVPGQLTLAFSGPGFDQGESGIGVVEGDAGETVTLDFVLTLGGIPASGLSGVVQAGLIIRDASGQAVNAVEAGGVGDFSAPVWIEFSPSDPVSGGEITKPVPVQISGDDVPEAHESFTVAVRAARASAGYAITLPSQQVVVTILNDEVELAVAPETAAAEDPAGDATVDVSVAMNGATAAHSSLVFPSYAGGWPGISARVTAQLEEAAGGGAIADRDFVPGGGEVTLPSIDGPSTLIVPVTILQDGEAEGEEFFVLRLSDANPAEQVVVVGEIGQVVIAANP